MTVTYTIKIEPARAGMVIATSSDGHSFATSTPLLAGARYWLTRGADPFAGILAIWSTSPDRWSLRSRIGTAARLRVEENDHSGPRFRTWTQFPVADGLAH